MLQLEIHVVNECNLACDGCQHWTNHRLGGAVPFETGAEWLTAWAARVEPARFKTMGGEPTLNPDLAKYICLAAELWPAADRMMTTNGAFLKMREADLKPALRETDTKVLLSRHSEDPRYVRMFDRAVATLADWGVWFKVDHESLTEWYRGYTGDGDAMRPFDHGDPRRSWEVCAARRCIQVHDNRLWKCPQIAYFGLVAAKFPGLDRDAWAPFLNYPGLGLDATDAEIAEFVGREDEAHLCSLCPARLETYRKEILPAGMESRRGLLPRPVSNPVAHPESHPGPDPHPVPHPVPGA